MSSTNIGLDHLAPLGSDSRDEAEHVHLPLSTHHVQHGVDNDEGARPPDTRTNGEGIKEKIVKYCIIPRQTSYNQVV